MSITSTDSIMQSKNFEQYGNEFIGEASFMNAKEVGTMEFNKAHIKGGGISAGIKLNLNIKEFICENAVIESPIINFPINTAPDFGNCKVIGEVHYVDFSHTEL